jgi:hypothetical protein
MARGQRPLLVSSPTAAPPCPPCPGLFAASPSAASLLTASPSNPLLGPSISQSPLPSPCSPSQVVAVAVSAETILLQTEDRIISQSANTRPSNTCRSYEPKQKEFKNWCDQMNFDETSRYTVTEQKLNCFLNDRVLYRELRRKRKHESTTENENSRVPENTRKVSGSTVELYIAAIVDLWSQQKARRANANPNPRGPVLKLLLEQVKREENRRKQQNYLDRGIGTLQDGYTSVDELKTLASAFLEDGTRTGLRDRCGLLLMHSGTLRSESIREFQLPDLFSLQLESEGATECTCMVMLLNQGKTNQFGRHEFCSMIRSKDVELCGKIK